MSYMRVGGGKNMRDNDLIYEGGGDRQSRLPHCLSNGSQPSSRIFKYTNLVLILNDSLHNRNQVLHIYR
jgi:hypothetical protein